MVSAKIPKSSAAVGHQAPEQLSQGKGAKRARSHSYPEGRASQDQELQMKPGGVLTASQQTKFSTFHARGPAPGLPGKPHFPFTKVNMTQQNLQAQALFLSRANTVSLLP